MAYMQGTTVQSKPCVYWRKIMGILIENINKFALLLGLTFLKISKYHKIYLEHEFILE